MAKSLTLPPGIASETVFDPNNNRYFSEGQVVNEENAYYAQAAWDNRRTEYLLKHPEKINHIPFFPLD